MPNKQQSRKKNQHQPKSNKGKKRRNAGTVAQLTRAVSAITVRARPKNRDPPPESMARFLAAHKDPFSPRAEGVRIPDPYAFPTACFTLRNKVQVQLNTLSPIQNQIGFIVYPHPFLTLWDNYSFQQVVVPANGPIITNSMVSLANNMYGLTTPGQLMQIVGPYRVVVAGWRIRVEMPELQRSGDITIAPILFPRALPSIAALSTNMATNSGAGTILAGGSNPAVVASNAILELPGARTMSLNDMVNQDIQLVSKPCSGNYTNFHTPSATPSYSATTSMGDDVLVSSTGVVSIPAMEDALDMSGMCGYAIFIDGLPTVGQVNIPVISLEIVMRLEGTPELTTASTATGVRPVPAGQAPCVAPRGMFDRAMDIIDANPGIATAAARMTNAFLMGGRNTRGLLH